MKKKFISLSLILCLIVGCLPITALGASSYSDLDESHWAYEKIMQVADAEVFTGTGANTFSPDATMTRAMFVSVLMRLEGGNPGLETVFTDVPQDSWYMGAVSWAHANGVADGVSPTEFAPDAAVNREQAASLLSRAFNITEQSTAGSAVFTDGAEISDWALSPVLTMRDKGYLNGYPDGSFKPKAELTRAEAAVLFAQFLNNSGTSGSSGTNSSNTESNKTYYTVTFETNNGSKIDPVQVEAEKVVTKPTNPTRSGYTFGSWYTDSALTTRYDFSAPVTENITLYASWTTATAAGGSGGGGGKGGNGGGGTDPQPSTYQVTFQSNGGSTVASQNIESGKTVTRPADPKRDGYTFTDWYKDSALTTPWDFAEDKVTSAITLYAGWKVALSGGGTEAEPYLLNSQKDLLAINNDPYATYKLTADIELTDWVPIEEAFNGVFDGDGKTVTINGITVSEDCETAGLFEFVDRKGVVSNVTVEGKIELSDESTINNEIYIGGIAGYNRGKIEASTVAASISLTAGSGTTVYVGGITGWNESGTIENCSATGSVTVSAGRNAYAGGIAGKNSTIISNCYSTGAVQVSGASGIQKIGGIAGVSIREPLTPLTIENCVALNPGLTLIEDGSAESMRARITTLEKTEIKLINNYAKVAGFNVDGASDDENGETILDNLELEESFYAETLGWYFGNNVRDPWYWDAGTTTPILWFQAEKDARPTHLVTFNSDGGSFVSSQTVISGSRMIRPADPKKEGYVFLGWYKDDAKTVFWDFNTDKVTENIDLTAGWERTGVFGEGTDENPYRIYSRRDLEAVGQYNNLDPYQDWTNDKSYLLVNDIMLDTWTPINGLSGTFDGNGKAITLTEITSEYPSYGLFDSVLSNGVVKNLTVKGTVNLVTESGRTIYFGGITAENSGNIQNCASFINISLQDLTTSYIGGLVGHNAGRIRDCYSYGTLEMQKGSGYAGGLVGYNEKDIDNCYSLSSIVSSGYAGGIAGYTEPSSLIYSAHIRNCVALNSKIETSGNAVMYSARIANNDNGSFTNNWALDLGGTYAENENDPDGKTITKEELDLDFFTITLDWSFRSENSDAPWIWNAEKSLPVLWFESDGVDAGVYQINFEPAWGEESDESISDEQIAENESPETSDEETIDSDETSEVITDETINQDADETVEILDL